MDDREKLSELLKSTPDVWMSDKSSEMLADHLIANGVTVQQWIPVTEPPKECGRYYCNVKSYAFPGSFYQDILHYDQYGFHDSGIYTDAVTHWMPLPQPPKGE